MQRLRRNTDVLDELRDDGDIPVAGDGGTPGGHGHQVFICAGTRKDKTFFTASFAPSGGGTQCGGTIATTRAKDASLCRHDFLWPEMLLWLLAVPVLVAAYVLLLRRRKKARSAMRA